MDNVEVSLMNLGLDITDSQAVRCAKLMSTVKTINDYMRLHQKNTQHMPIEFNEQVFRAYVADYPKNQISWQGLGKLDMDHDYYRDHILSQEADQVDLQTKDKNAALLAGTLRYRDYDLSYYQDLLAKRFDLIDCETMLRTQKPGDVHGFHYDSMYLYYINHYLKADPERHKLPYDPETMWADDGTIPVRLFLALDDWRYGQIWMFGNTPWTNWKAGDVMWFDWRYTPHCTANASIYDRPIMRITARISKENPMYTLFQKQSVE